MNPVCRDFAIGYLVAALALIGVSLILRAMTGIDLTRATVLIVLVSAAYWAGLRHGRRTRAPAESGFAWRATACMVAVAVVMSVGVVGVIWLVMPANVAGALWTTVEHVKPVWYAVAGVAVFVIYVLFIRFFFGKGAKVAVKEMERRRKRDLMA